MTQIDPQARAVLVERLQTLRDRGAARAGIALPPRSFPARAVIDLRDPAGTRP